MPAAVRQHGGMTVLSRDGWWADAVTTAATTGTTEGPSAVGRALGSGMPSWLLVVVGIVVIALAIRVASTRGDQQGPRRPEDGPRRPFRP